MHDIVIRGGTVVDGSGLPAFPADIGITGDVITAIGRIRSEGRREIDARGKIVSPGFIDGHAHVDAQINWDPLGTSSCWQGVTTLVMGNCGFTLAPSRADARGLVVRNLERAEDISAAAMAQGIEWKWETFPEYLDVLDALPKGLNHAVYMGHSALRTWAMGSRAFEEQASDDDMALMLGQLRAGLDAGAIGFSTSRSINHETSDDKPVASRVGDWNEVRALVNSMGGGVFELAISNDMRNLDPDLRRAGTALLKDLAVESGIPLTFGTVMGTVSNPDVWRSHLRLLDETAAAGGVMFGQSHSRDVTVLLSFRSNLPFDKLPLWKQFRAQPLDAQRAQLRDPAIRARLEEEANNGPYGRAIGTEARAPKWQSIYYYDQPLPPHRSIAEIAAERGTSPVATFIDLALESDLECFFQQYIDRFDRDSLEEIMRHPRTIMTFSDTGAHVGQISDCSIFAHMLGYWVRQTGRFTLEEAIRMMTLAPARAWGFADRGLLRPGMKADVVVFDAARISPDMPQVVHDLPGGARRLLQRASGIEAVLVNGSVLMEHGEHSGALPGRLLRRAA